jgi:hypothetical protein
MDQNPQESHMKTTMVIFALVLGAASFASAKSTLVMKQVKFNSKHLSGPAAGEVVVDYAGKTVNIKAKSSKGVSFNKTLKIVRTNDATCYTRVTAESETSIESKPEQQMLIEDYTGTDCKFVMAPSGNGSYTTHARDNTGKVVKFESTFKLSVKKP